MKINLFLKIYLSFLFTAIAAIGGSIYLERLADSGSRIHLWRSTSLSFYAGESVRILEREGLRGLEDYFSRLEKTTGIRAFLFDASGKNVTGRPVRDRIAEKILDAQGRPDSEPAFLGDFLLRKERVVGEGGRVYILAAAYPPPPGRPPGPPPGPPSGSPPGPPGPPGFSLHFLVRLSVQLLIAGIICYLLARYLTSPIIRIGSAARQFAAGDLSARVGPDVGRRKDELAGLALDFDLMASRIESLLTSQRNLLRDVSHELRSPLARLHVALELCRKRLGSRQMEPLDRIEMEAGKLNDLIGQILIYNRIESGAAEHQRMRIDLAALIGEIIADANFEVNSNRASILKAEPAILDGDPNMLRRAFENTIRNALHHAGNVPVEISLESIGLDENLCARITVRDHGMGVQEDELDLIFRPFYKSAHRERGEGAGLGLAIADAAVRLHGGTIKARNASGGGLIVEIRLPLSKTLQVSEGAKG